MTHATNDNDRVPIVVFDDGALTKASFARIARFARTATLIGGSRSAMVAPVLIDAGVEVAISTAPISSLREAVIFAVRSGVGILVCGTPFDAHDLAEQLRDIHRQLGSDSALAVYIAAPGQASAVHGLAPFDPALVLSRARGIVQALARVSGLTLAGIPRPGEDAALLIEALGMPERDLVCCVGGSAAVGQNQEQTDDEESHAAVAPRASDIIHTLVTDTGLEVTNRTANTIDVRARLGATHNPHDDLGSVQITLAPGEGAQFDAESVPAWAALDGPVAELRQWSHEAEVVYEGGSRRINGVDVRYRSVNGVALAVRSYGSRRGLVVAVTAAEIAEALGLPFTSAGENYDRLSGQGGHGISLADAVRRLTERDKQNLSGSNWRR